MKRPTSLRIIGKVHEIVYLPAGQADLKDGDDTFAGRISHDSLRISIEDGQPLAIEQDTVLHEAFHGVERAMNLDLPEDTIHRLATGLLAVLKDNPSFIAYLRRKK